MQLLQKRISTVAAVVLAMIVATPVRGEMVVIEAYTAASGGLTRDSLSDGNLTQTKTAHTANRTAARRRRARTDPKDFVATRPHHHPRATRQSESRVAAAPSPKRRAPIVSFVYWWNGWVIRTFHTKFGTVLLGTVGSQS